MTEKSLNPTPAPDPYAAQASPGSMVRVWDAPTRLFHWTLVVLVGFSWYTADRGWLDLHQWSGIAVLTLLLFRIAWGIVGSTTAQFTDFVAGPGAVIGYLVSLAKGQKPLHAGHNPAGGWMVMVLILVLLVQVTLGLFANDDLRFDAPLSMLIAKDWSDRLTQIHGALFNVLLVLIWLHVVAAGFYVFVKGENLVKAMISGHKPHTHVPPDAKLRFTRAWLALLILGLSACVVAVVLN